MRMHAFSSEDASFVSRVTRVDGLADCGGAGGGVGWGEGRAGPRQGLNFIRA